MKDKDLAVGMLQVVDGIMLDFSIDVQLRVLNGLQVVLGKLVSRSEYPSHGSIT